MTVEQGLWGGAAGSRLPRPKLDGSLSLTTLVLPHSRTSAAEARRLLRSELRDAGVDEMVLDDATLVLSELVGNAVLHGRPLEGGAIKVEWHAGTETVELAITDGGGLVVPRPRVVDRTAPGGRGLSIVAQLAEEWGVETRHDGMTVWARLRSRLPKPSGMGASSAVPGIVATR